MGEGVNVTIIDISASHEILQQRAAEEDDKFNEKAFHKRLKSIPEAK